MKFFSPVLTNKRIETKLSELENSDRIYPENIIEACSFSSELEIAHTFPTALKSVLANHKFYDLIIIDRNLSLYPYYDDLEDVKEMLNGTGHEYSDDRILYFHEREGDLLLLVLLRLDPAYKDKIYYLTANTSDDIRGSHDLQTLLELDQFKQDHIIEKGSPSEKKISAILSDIKAFRIQNAYRAQCSILRRWLDEESVDQFISMVKHYEKNERREFVFDLRNLLENLLNKIAYSMGEHNADYWKSFGRRSQLQIRPFILSGLKSYNDIYNIGYTAVVLNACISIYSVSSDCVVHSQTKSVDIEKISAVDLTDYTMNTLINEICDVILWFDKAMDRIALIV